MSTVKLTAFANEEDPQLSGLDVLVIPVLDNPANPKRARQLAYAKVWAPVVSVVQGSTEAEIVLPGWWDSRPISPDISSEMADISENSSRSRR